MYIRNRIFHFLTVLLIRAEVNIDRDLLNRVEDKREIKKKKAKQNACMFSTMQIFTPL